MLIKKGDKVKVNFLNRKSGVVDHVLENPIGNDPILFVSLSADEYHKKVIKVVTGILRKLEPDLASPMLFAIMCGELKWELFGEPGKNA